jgi:hypothetical protein
MVDGVRALGAILEVAVTELRPLSDAPVSAIVVRGTSWIAKAGGRSSISSRPVLTLFVIAETGG